MKCHNGAMIHSILCFVALDALSSMCGHVQQFFVAANGGAAGMVTQGPRSSEAAAPRVRSMQWSPFVVRPPQRLRWVNIGMCTGTLAFWASQQVWPLHTVSSVPARFEALCSSRHVCEVVFKLIPWVGHHPRNEDMSVLASMLLRPMGLAIFGRTWFTPRCQ